MLEDGRKYYLTYCKELFTYCLTFSMQMYVIFLIISSTDNYDDGVIFRRLRRIPNILLLEMIPLFLVACMTPIAFLLVYCKYSNQCISVNKKKTVFLFKGVPYHCLHTYTLVYRLFLQL